MVLRLQRLFGCLGMGALVAIALVPMPALAAASWHVSVGDQTSDAGVQANGFFNNNITVDVGDTVNWSWNAEEIHSVTFLSGAQEPLLFSPSGGQLNPNIPAFFPVGNGSSYDGTGFRSSGVFGTPFAPTNTFSLTFTKTGTFSYVCLVHAGMDGSVTVNPAGTAYPATQADYNAAAQTQETRLLTLGANGLVDRALGRANPSNVTVGVGQLVNNIGSLAVLRFEPDKRVVHVGDTVTWTNLDPQTPHTVTFGPENFPNPFASYPPTSNVSGGHATISNNTDLVNSGFVANDPLFKVSNTFSATFTTPGTYPYVCALHDTLGMTGTIVVLP